MPELACRVASLQEHARRDGARVIGVGLVMPGPFGVTGPWPTRLPGWDRIALRTMLEDKIGLPVMLANDAKGATLAEWRFGDARRRENFAYVFIGNGIGTGHVMNGQLVGGAAGNDGELAHIVVRPGGHSCICGKRGCLET
ncbi:MAG: ROK family protein [Acetobacteraceae bacterium]